MACLARDSVVEDAADAARDVAVGKEEIVLRPFREARIEGRVVRGAGGPQPGVEGFGVLVIGDGRVEVGAAAEPALGGGQEARVHVDGGHMRIGHVRDQADPGGEEAGVFLGAVDACGELGREAAADGRDVDADFLEHLVRSSARVRRRRRAAVGVGAVPWDVIRRRPRCRPRARFPRTPSQMRSRSDSNQSRAACCCSSSGSMAAL